ncbi:MAG: tRNA (N6-isopentenyl adenosine(37)-C2)-methylthiotransferase MiaB [Firmicutes bacterium]|nr:tRNA (N6-isopentenyl adenosine(37)-C2)-methylthiotransferase MiaB [Bacillota bacterium]
MNERDTETMKGLLAQDGYTFTDSPEDADLIVYNTCCVRENPERKVYGQVGSLKELKEKHPDLIIAITGCMPQQPEELEQLRQRLTHVDLIIGTHNTHRLPELLHRIEETGERIIEVWDEPEGIVEGLPAQREGRFKAFVNIMYGCTNFCTYCIVPYTRGPERSRHPEEILKEITDLTEKGFVEFTLLGQNVNSYGKDLGLDMDFAALLRQVDAIPGVRRIRFMTSHPKDITPALIDAMAELPKVCEHLHLPVQAGSNKVLQQMNRKYTVERYLEIVDRLRERIPNIHLTTDLIVGFPGETEEDFQDTLDLVRRVEYDSAFTFIYSPRTGTPAAKRSDQVPEEIKKDRIHRLIELQNSISAEKNQRMVGKEEEVLVEGRSQGGNNTWVGRTRGNKLISFIVEEGDFIQPGDFATVRITTAQTFSLQGELVKD